MAFEVWQTLIQIPTRWLSDCMTFATSPQPPPPRTHADTFDLERGVCSGPIHFWTPTLPTYSTGYPPCAFNFSFFTTFSKHITSSYLSIFFFKTLSPSSLGPIRDSSSLSVTSPYSFLSVPSFLPASHLSAV